MKITHIRRVTPDVFCNWLIRKTEDLPGRRFPDEEWKSKLETAVMLEDQRVAIESYYPISDKDDPTGEQVVRLPRIQFDLIQLDAERSEIEAWCDNSESIHIYFDELMGEIEKRWKAEDSSDKNAQGNLNVGNDYVAGDKNIGRDQLSANRDVHVHNYPAQSPVNLELKRERERQIRFEVLPNVWEKSLGIVDEITRLVAPRIWLPPIENFPGNTIEDLVRNSDLTEEQKTRILRDPDPFSRLKDQIGSNQASEATSRLWEYREFLQKNKLHLHAGLFAQLENIDRTCEDTISAIYSNSFFPLQDHVLERIRNEFGEKISPIMANVENIMRARLDGT